MAELAPGWKKISKFVFRSPEGELKTYAQYRDITGLCDVCGLAIKGHPCCEACSILTGPGHLEYSSGYREHEVCGHCRLGWRNQEERIGRETTLEEFRNPQLLPSFPAKQGEPYHLSEDEEDPIMEVVHT